MKYQMPSEKVIEKILDLIYDLAIDGKAGDETCLKCHLDLAKRVEVERESAFTSVEEWDCWLCGDYTVDVVYPKHKEDLPLRMIRP